MLKRYFLIIPLLSVLLLLCAAFYQKDQPQLENLVVKAEKHFLINLDTAYQQYEAILPLAKETQDWENFVLVSCRLSEMNAFWGDTLQARFLLENALEAIPTETKSDLHLHIAQQKISNILFRNEPEKAFKLIEQLEANYLLNTPEQQFKLALHKGEANLWKRAVMPARKALRTALKIKSIDTHLYQRVYVNLGYSFLLQGKLDSANYYLRQSLEQTANSKRDHFWAKTHLGLCDYVRGNWQGFIEHAVEAVQIADEYTKREFHQKSALYKILGASYLKIGDYEKTVDYSRKASRVSLLFRDTLESVTCRMNMASGLFHLGEYKESIATYLEILPIFKANGDITRETSTLNQLGVLYDRRNEYEKAIQYHKAALDKKIEKLGKNVETTAMSYYNLGAVSRKMGDYTAAITYLQKCLDIRSSLAQSQQAELSSTYNQLGQIYLAQNRYQTALEAFQTAIKILTPAYDDSQMEVAPKLEQQIISKLQLLYPLRGKASVFHALYRENNTEIYLQASTVHFERAFELIDELRIDFLGQNSKQELVRIANTIYEDAIQHQIYAYQQNKDKKFLREAYRLTEASKSVLLNEAIQSVSAISSASLPRSISEKEQNLRLQLTNAEKNVYTNTDTSQQEALQDTLFGAKKQYDDFVTSLSQKYPAYHRIKYDRNILSLEEVQAKLTNPETALVEYFVGENTIYVFVIGHENYEVITLARNFPLAKWVVQLQKSVYTYHTSGTRSPKLYATYADSLAEAAHQLYTKLFSPIETAYKLPERLVIIPDGLLGYIPFELLLKNLPEDNTLFGGHDYLIKDYQISYTYSASLLDEVQQKELLGKRKNFVAFAPTFSSKVADVSENNTRTGLSELKYNIPEAESLQKLLGGQIFTAMDATEARFTDIAPDYKIIHLATHGKANDKVGDYAYLAFTEIKDSIENELLYNRDLYNLRLNADMVVLSACETGIGELQRGEGIISLARGFSYAGAKSIITTLWSVNDEKTKELMERFYTYIQAGRTKDVALRKAKLDFIQQYKSKAHPFYWAAFIPIGDMEAIELKSDFNLIWVLACVVFVSLLTWFFFKKRKPV